MQGTRSLSQCGLETRSQFASHRAPVQHPDLFGSACLGRHQSPSVLGPIHEVRMIRAPASADGPLETACQKFSTRIVRPPTVTDTGVATAVTDSLYSSSSFRCMSPNTLAAGPSMYRTR